MELPESRQLGSRKETEGPLALAPLALLVFALSLVAWNARLESDAELSLYAVSDSLARYGRWDIDQVGWLSFPAAEAGSDGLPQARSPLGLSVLALPLTFLGLWLPDSGPVHTTLLLGPLLHTLTALYLYQTIRTTFSDAGRGGALLAMLLWAIASPALAYVKRLTFEPALALSLIAAFYHLALFREDDSWRSPLLAGLWLALSLFIEPSTALLVPFYVIPLLAFAHRHWYLFPMGRVRALRSDRATASRLRHWQAWLLDDWVLRRVILFVLPVLIGGAMTIWSEYDRFGGFPVLLPDGHGPMISWPEQVALTWVSFGWGLLPHAPWALLAVGGAWAAWRRAPALAAAALFIFIAATVLPGGRLGQEWWAFWGPRAAIPVLPLLAWFVAPILAWGRRALVLAVMLGIAAFFLNLPGLLWPMSLYDLAIASRGLELSSHALLFEPALAPLPVILQAGLRDGATLDLAWIVSGAVERRPLALLLAIALAGTGAGSWGWRRARGEVVVAAGVVLVAVGLWLLLGDLRWLQGRPVEEAFAVLPEPLPTGAQLWYDDPAASDLLLNQVRAPIPIRAPAALVDDPARVVTLERDELASIFLLTPHPVETRSDLERLLLADLYHVDESAGERYRLIEFWRGDLGDWTLYDTTPGAPLALTQGRVTDNPARGDVLAVELRWRVDALLPAGFRPDVWLVDDRDRIIAPIPLSSRFENDESWQPGRNVADRRALRLSRALPPGAYSLLVSGAYAGAEGSEVRIPVTVR